MDPSDWIRAEAGYALREGIRVVTLRMPEFEMPESLPAELAQLAEQNGVNYQHEYSRATIDRVLSMIND